MCMLDIKDIKLPQGTSFTNYSRRKDLQAITQFFSLYGINICVNEMLLLKFVTEN